MKKTLLSFIVLISNTIFSQQYIPLVKENVQWNICVTERHYDVTDTVIQKYYISGDSLVNNYNYKKVYRKDSTQVWGLIREENKKVYYTGRNYWIAIAPFYSSVNESELMLYDFSKQVGDTVFFYYTPLGGVRVNYYVTGIDSVEFRGTFRKRFENNHFFGGKTEYVIEGLGNQQKGLLTNTDLVIPTSTNHSISYELVCYSENGETIYINPDYIDCNSIRKVSSGIKKVETNEFVVFPTRTKGQLCITADGIVNTPLKISIFDYTGKKVETKNILFDNKFYLNLSCLTKGLYIIQLESERIKEIYKIMVE